MLQQYNMPYRRQKLRGNFFVIFLLNPKHYNIVDNFNLYDKIKTA